MIAALQRVYAADDFVLYTHWAHGDAPRPEAIQERVQRSFGLALPRAVTVVQLRGIKWVEASSYPRFTLLLQSLGALPLAWEALRARPPDVWIDSMGYAMSYPLAGFIAGCRVACYVHYPTVSTDMFAAVASGRAAHNNARWVAKSRLLTLAKVMYYRAFGVVYGWCGRWAEVVMVNSSWTKGHIVHIWGLPEKQVLRVYPPCDCRHLLQLPGRRPLDSIVSVAQFRPEKDHPLQLEAFRLLRERHPGAARGLSLHLVGGVRNAEDEGRVAALRALAEKLCVADAVVFHVNQPYGELCALLGRSVAGLHTMWNEHFGIGVVEYMAAGCIPVAHRSGGPMMDIVGEGYGYLAVDAEGYCEALHAVLTMPEEDRDRIRTRARARAELFSEEVFNEAVTVACKDLAGSAMD